MFMALILLIPPIIKTEQEKFEDAWPKGVPYIEGLKVYKSNHYSQSIYELNGRDTNDIVHANTDDRETINPNRFFPWNRPGGTNFANVKNRVAVYLPGKVTIWQDRVRVPLGSRPFPKWFWSFPNGTIFVDQLLNKDGDCFELRTREKIDGKWIPTAYRPYPEKYEAKETLNQKLYNDPQLQGILQRETINYNYYPVKESLRDKDFVATNKVFIDDDLIPKGYFGPGMACAECHIHSGAQINYGIGVRGGGDGNFSFSPFIEGTYTPDKLWFSIVMKE